MFQFSAYSRMPPKPTFSALWRAFDEIFRFWNYDFRILHIRIKKCANFQLIWEWLQNRHFLLCGELLMKISDSEIMIFVFYTSELRNVPIFSLFENDSKTKIFSSVRALDKIFRFWDYDFCILLVKIKKRANFQLIWEWLQNQHFQLCKSSWWNFQILRLWFLNFTWQN